ncbi:hypothetical protein EG68_09504 [Paragonimus skrjabini miyazakii]|uniref:Uncharacterized protein n=1 Tax=Paragonimus skrjabini miyazakii TaxID=59628 RepID=A0A8S9YHF3_9TREM|nr:hypothetical protein EG68_09504 [Paragonimus skrjabini miyazakii]
MLRDASLFYLLLCFRKLHSHTKESVNPHSWESLGLIDLYGILWAGVWVLNRSKNVLTEHLETGDKHFRIGSIILRITFGAFDIDTTVHSTNVNHCWRAQENLVTT